MSNAIHLDSKRLDEFRRFLTQDGRARIDRRALWQAFAKAFPHRPASEERTWLLHALHSLSQDGVVKLPSLKGPRWDRTRLPYVPTGVDLMLAKRPSEAPWRSYAWHPDIAWASELPYLSDAHYHFLRRVNDALARGELDYDAPIKYRSLQLTGAEKDLGRLLKGALFAPGRLSPQLLRFVPDKPPLAFTEFGRAGALLVVENAGTYFTASRTIRELPNAPYAAIAYGDGGRVTASLPAEPRLERFASIDYLGDLDWAGLAILHRLGKRLDEQGFSLQPAAALVEAMLDAALAFGQPEGWPAQSKSVPRNADTLLNPYSSRLRARIRRILDAGRRVPEEVLGPRELRAVWNER